MPSSNAQSNGALSLRGWAAEAEAAANIAKALAPTSFIPDHLKVWVNPEERNPDKKQLDYDATVAQIAAVLLAGQELELKPMASLRAFVIIRGTVALYAIAARGLLQHQGHEITVVESTSVRAVVRGRRAGTDDYQTSTWDLDRAKLAQLYPGRPDGNWRKSPKAMLVARATAEASRWVASDALLGLPPIVEEVQDAEVEVVPIAAIEAPAPEVPEQRTATRPRRNTGKRAALPSAAPGLPPPEPPAPPADPEPPREPQVTKAQLAKLHTMLGKLRISGPEEGLGLIAVWAGHPIESTKDLTRAELEVVFERIESLLSIAAQDQAGEEDQAADAPDDDGPMNQGPDLEPGRHAPPEGDEHPPDEPPPEDPA
jgi:hypothetical protein